MQRELMHPRSIVWRDVVKMGGERTCRDRPASPDRIARELRSRTIGAREHGAWVGLAGRGEPAYQLEQPSHHRHGQPQG